MDVGGGESAAKPAGFWERHGFLVAGIGLPLLVVLAFVLARTLPRLWVPEPRFDVLYGVRTSNGAAARKVDASVNVADGRLHVRWTKADTAVYYQTLHVFRLHPTTGAVDEIKTPEPPASASLEKPLDLDVPGLEGFRIDTSPRAPDGYEFGTRSGQAGWFLGDVFGNHYRGPRSLIAKGGRVVEVPTFDADGYGSAGVEFLGWLVPGTAGR